MKTKFDYEIPSLTFMDYSSSDVFTASAVGDLVISDTDNQVTPGGGGWQG